MTASNIVHHWTQDDATETAVVELEICEEWWTWSGCQLDYGSVFYPKDAMDLYDFDGPMAFPVYKPNFNVFGPPRRTRKQRGWYQIKPYPPPMSAELTSCESSRSYATGADLPPELWKRISKDLEGADELELGPAAYDELELGDDTVRALSCLSIVCRQWAKLGLGRKRLFSRLHVRSQQDALDLCKFSRDPSCQFLEHLEKLYVRVKTFAEPPWLHSLPLHLFQYVELSLYGPDLTLPTGCKSLRSLHPGLPRSLPCSLPRLTHLNLSELHFPRLDDLMHLVSELPDLDTVYCTEVTWDSLPTALPRRRKPPVGRPKGHQIAMTDCSPTSCQASILAYASLRNSHLMHISPDDLAALFALVPILNPIATTRRTNWTSSFATEVLSGLDDTPEKIVFKWYTGVLILSFMVSPHATRRNNGIAITDIVIHFLVDPDADTPIDWTKLDLVVSSSFPLVDKVMLQFSNSMEMLSFTLNAAAKMPLSYSYHLLKYAVGDWTGYAEMEAVVELEIYWKWQIWSGCQVDYSDIFHPMDTMDEDDFDESTAFPVVKPNFDVFGAPHRTRKQRGWYRIKPYPHPKSTELAGRESSHLYAGAADIPPELFGSIIEEAAGDDRHRLSRLSLVCRHWARLCRKILFKNLHIRSQQDAVKLREFYKDPDCRFLDDLSTLIVTVKTRVEPPWLHSLPLHLFRKLDLHVDGADPTFQTGSKRFRSLHHGLPRSPPHVFRGFKYLCLSDLSFPRMDDLVHLFRELPDLEKVDCIWTRWKSLPTTLPRRCRPIRPSNYYQIEMSDCSLISCQALVMVHASHRNSHLMLLSPDDLAALFAFAPILDAIPIDGLWRSYNLCTVFAPAMDDAPEAVVIDWHANELQVSFRAPSRSTTGGTRTVAITVITISPANPEADSDKLTDIDWVKFDIAISNFPFVNTVVVGFSDKEKMLRFTKDVGAKLPLSTASRMLKYAVRGKVVGGLSEWHRVTSGWEVDKTLHRGKLHDLYT